MLINNDNGNTISHEKCLPSSSIDMQKYNKNNTTCLL